MRYLPIDIETYCELRVDGCGVYRYAEHPTFEVLLLAYAFDGEEVRLLDRPTRGLTHELMRGLLDPGVIKVAHNANFEITCLSAWLGVRLDPSQWECTMVGAAYLGLPLALGHVAEVLQLAEAKDARGKALISYFCRPCRPTPCAPSVCAMPPPASAAPTPEPPATPGSACATSPCHPERSA